MLRLVGWVPCSHLGSKLLGLFVDAALRYLRDGEWLVSAMTTETLQDGEAVTRAIMRQPMGALRQSMGAGPLSCACFLPYPECITHIAFEPHADRSVSHGNSRLCWELVWENPLATLTISLNEGGKSAV